MSEPERCPFCAAELDVERQMAYGLTKWYACMSVKFENEPFRRSKQCYEAELAQLRGLLHDFLHNPHRQSLMGWWNLFNSALGFKVNGEAFLAKPEIKALMKEGG